MDQIIQTKPIKRSNYTEKTVSLSISPFVWLLLFLISTVMFALFIILDPQPNLVLALCCALTFWLMGFGVIRLYSLRLLLSPFAAVLIGPGNILYYTIGNLGPRIAGENRFAANLYSLEYYPLAATLSLCGMAIFFLVVFGIFRKSIIAQNVKYQDLDWHPWQALVSTIIAVSVLLYMSSKYEFRNGYFRGVESVIDRFLAGSQYLFISLSIFISISVLLKNKLLVARLTTIVNIVLLVALTIGLRSRTSMLVTLVAIGLSWLTIAPKQAGRILLLGCVGGAFVFLLGTQVKTTSVQGTTLSIIDNFMALSGVEWSSLQTTLDNSSDIDVQYRLAGLELPAALIASLERGIPPLYGQAMVDGLSSILPNFLRTKEIISERITIFTQFRGPILQYGDSIGIILSSGLADWGIILSPFIYLLMALICIIMWRIVQKDPRLLLAYLSVALGPTNSSGLVGDLLWENIATNIKAMGFALILIIILSPVLAPRNISHAQIGAEV